MLHNPNLAQAPSSSVPLEVDDFVIDGAGTSRGKLRRRLLWAGGIFLGLVLVLIAAIALVITQSIELPFLRHQVDAVIEDALGDGYDATIGGATLAVDPVLGLVVKLTDIRVVDSLDNEVMRIPSAMLAVSVSGLVNSREVVRSVEIDNPWISIRRDNGLAFLGTAATPAVANVPPVAAAPHAMPNGFDVLSDPIEALDKSLEDLMALAQRGFSRIDVVNATVELWTRGELEPHRFERADVRIQADPATGHLGANMTASGYSGRWSVSADRTLNSLTGGRTLALQFSQLTLADFFPAVGGVPSLITTDIPFYGRAVIGLDADGHVVRAETRLDLGSGYFAFGPEAKPIVLDNATIHLRWDVPNNVILVDPSPFYFGRSGASVAGSIRPDGEGRFAFDLQSDDAVLAPSNSPAPPLAVQSIRLAGDVDLGQGVLNFDRASIVTANGSLIAAGSIGLERGGPSIAFAATLTEMPIDVLKQLWPPGLQDGGRNWMLSAMTGGTVSGTLDARIPAGALAPGGVLTPDMLDLELTLSNASFKTFDGFPNIVEASGRAVLAGTHFAVDLDSGAIVAPSGDRLQITAGAFVIGETAARVPTGHIEMHTVGPAIAFASIANEEPIRALQPFGVLPSDVHGNGEAQLSANWPLVDGVSMDEIEWRIALTLNDLSSDVELNGMAIHNGDVLLNITPTVINITGTANVDGVPANLDLAFPLVAEVDGRQQLRMVLDEEARRQLGFNLEGFLGGTVTALVTDLGENGPGQHFDLDLGQARVILAPLGWSKPVGVPATMSFDLLTVDGGYHIRNLVLQGDGFGLTGEADMDANYSITSARVTHFALSDTDAVSFTFDPFGNGWAIEAQGSSFDVRDLLHDGIGDIGDTGEATDLSIRGHFDHLVGFNGERIDNADVTFVSVGGATRSIVVTGTMGGALVSVTYDNTNGEGGATLSAYSGNAGALLGFANIYDRINGGELWINGAETTDGALYGQAQMTNFTVIDEPALARLMAPPQGEADDADNVLFDHLTFGYLQRGSMLTIQDILLRGGDMGATGRRLDRFRRRANGNRRHLHSGLRLQQHVQPHPDHRSRARWRQQ